MKTRLLNLALGISLFTSLSAAKAIDPQVKQLVLSIAPTWKSHQGKMQLFVRGENGEWVAQGSAWPVLYGKNGLAWGRGIKGFGDQESGPQKVERDGRAPAGVFTIGKIYTYDSALPENSKYPFHQVTHADAWVDDVHLPNYNQFVTIPDPKNPPAWFEKNKMRHNDFAYRWLVEIRHNADPPVPGKGSAIFFHIRRGASRPTSGCTTMASDRLANLITWLRADDHPQYVLLPWSEYERKWQAWGLPKLIDVKQLHAN